MNENSLTPCIRFYRILPAGNLSLISSADGIDVLTRELPPGFYTTFRTFEQGTRVLGLSAHLDRLYRPAESCGIDLVVGRKGLRKQLFDLLQLQSGDARVRLVLTYDGALYVMFAPLLILPETVYNKGVKTITVNVQREKPRIKSTNFISSSQEARNYLQNSDVFEALLSKNDVILEGMTSNFFYIHDGLLWTARNNVLLGVTRRTILRVARKIGIGVMYQPLELEQISGVSEAFISSSSRGIVPVVQVNSAVIGTGNPGSLTKKLSTAYENYIVNFAELILPLGVENIGSC